MFLRSWIIIACVTAMSAVRLTADESTDITITSPASGVALVPGQHFTVVVSVVPNKNIRSAYVAGEGLFSGLHSGPPFVFDMVVPDGRAYRTSLVAVGTVEGDDSKQVKSKPITVDIQAGNDGGCSLEWLPKNFDATYIGEQLDIGLVGLRCGAARFIDVKRSSATAYSAGDNSVARVDGLGVITAVGSGRTTVSISTKGRIGFVNVLVSGTMPGDLDGDGRVTSNDLRILSGFIGTDAACRDDARDLNRDGKIDEKDVDIMQKLIEEQSEKDKDRDNGKDRK